MLFAHLKRILRLDRLRLRGPLGAQDEFLLAATAGPPEARKAGPDLCAPARLGAIKHPCAGRIVRSKIACSRTSSTQSAKSRRDGDLLDDRQLPLIVTMTARLTQYAKVLTKGVDHPFCK